MGVALDPHGGVADSSALSLDMTSMGGMCKSEQRKLLIAERGSGTWQLCGS